MKKRFEIEKNKKLYKVVVSYLDFNIFEVNVYEIIHPTWKIFRTTIFPLGFHRFVMENNVNIQWQVSNSIDTIFKQYEENIECTKKITNYFDN